MDVLEPGGGRLGGQETRKAPKNVAYQFYENNQQGHMIEGTEEERAALVW